MTGPALALLGALGIGAVLILIFGKNPIVAYSALLVGAFGSPSRIAETLVAATPLTLMGLGILIAFKSSSWNIGAQGQGYIGAITATWFAVYVPLPAYLHIPLVILMGFVGGALWAMIPAILKVRFGISEIVMTIMLNYIAQDFVYYLIETPNGPMVAPNAAQPMTANWLPTAVFPVLFGRLRMDFLIALLAIPIVYILMTRTTLGYKLRVAGENEKVAKYSGINTARMVILAMAVSGGLIGIAATGEIATIVRFVFPDFDPGYVWNCIPVALLANLNPLGILPAAIIFGVFYSGGLEMTSISGVPPFITDIITGTVIILVLAFEFIKRRR